MSQYLKYQGGDIVGVMGGGMSQVIEAVFEPPTRLYHFLVLDRYDFQADDIELHEAIASGVRGGRLSWYQNDVYVVFRIVDPDVDKLGNEVGFAASEFGRWGYDFLMYPFLLKEVIRVEAGILRTEHRLRRIRPAELRYYDNHAVICTEFANALWKKEDRPPIPNGVNALPAGYIEAFQAGKLRVVGINIPPTRRDEPAVLKLLEQFGAALVRPQPGGQEEVTPA